MPLSRWFALLLLAAVGALAQAQDGARFDILEYEVLGNSVLAVPVVEQAVLPHMGEQRTLDDVELARAALEKAYQDAGYLTVLVDVPEQRIDGGLVRLRVTEGRVERLRVTGSRYVDQGVIRERVHQLAPGRVPDFNAMQQQLASLAREERQIQPLLRPGLTPGTVEAELRVTDELPLAANVELNNRHAADTSALRAQGTVRYDNLFQRDHSISLTAITAPQRPAESTVFSLGWTAPLEGGATLATSLVLSDSTVEPLGAVTVLGKGVSLGLRWAQTHASAGAFHTFTAGLDYKRFQERVVAGGSELSTPLRYLPFSASYSGSWFSREAQTSFNAGMTWALRGLLARDVDCPGNLGPVDQFACKREGADGSFATLRADLRHTQAGLTLRAAGQLSQQPLVSSEQYTIGGADTVRGYYEAEASGDLGWLGSIEWRSSNLAAAPQTADRLQSLALVVFADAGQVRIRQPAAGQAARVSLAGSGLGLRVRARPDMEAELELAWPLKATRASPEHEPRLHVRLAARF